MNKISSTRISLKWAMIYGIIAIIFNTGLYSSDWWKNWIVTLAITILLYLIILFFAMNEYKTLNNGIMMFSEGISMGLLAISVGGFIGLVYDFVYRIYINPNILKLQAQLSQMQYEKMGMTPQQIQEALSKSYSTSGLAFVVGIIIIIIVGLICSIIMSLFMKSDNSELI